MVKKSILQSLAYFLSDPRCVVCNRPLEYDEQVICSDCVRRLDLYAPEKSEQCSRRVSAQLLPTSHYEAAASLMIYRKGYASREMIHSLKYYGNRRVGYQLGVKAAKHIAAAALFGHIDYLLPVPLHPKRQSKRGYNQAEVLCRAIGRELHIPVMTDNLIRTVHAVPFAKLDPGAVRCTIGYYHVVNTDLLAGKTVLVVDDVFTTGATARACDFALESVPNLTRYYYAIAYAGRR